MTKMLTSFRPTPARTTAEILVRGRYASVPAEYAQLVVPVLKITFHDVLAANDTGLRLEKSEAQFWFANQDGGVEFPAGLVSRVVGALHRAGHLVSVEWRSDERGPMPAVKMLKHPQAVPAERAFLRRLMRRQIGQVVHRTACERASNIARMASFFPDSKIFVVATGRRSARQLAKQVRRFVDHGEMHTDIQQAWLDPSRLYVGTAPQFASVSVAEDWDLVVFANWRLAIMPASRAVIFRYLSRKRVYAFVRAGERMDELQRLQLEIVAGEVLYLAPQARGEQIPTDVMMVTPPATPMRTAGLSALERKQMAIWRNELRNRAIVEIALGLAFSNDEMLFKHGLFLPSEMETSGTPATPVVAIYAEALEHARELEQLLREMSGPGLDGPRRGTKGGVKIVTLTKVIDKGMTADVLVRADGTSDPLTPLRWRPARGGQPRLVVDVRDDWDEQAERDVVRRLADYSSAGWTTGQSIADKPGSLSQPQPARQEPVREQAFASS